jgi:subtilisin family serine protease
MRALILIAGACSMKKPFVTAIESLETRRLFAWSSYAQLVNQDVAASNFSSITGKGVTVAVVDTGIDYTQSALGGGIGKNFKVLGGYDFYSNDSDPMDTSGHGTSVAGVIAAESYAVNGVHYQGVAPDANLVALRVGTESSIPTNNIKKALDWIIANHDKYGPNGINVVNLSIGSGNYTDPTSGFSYSSEFQTLRDMGIFIVAASGNSHDEAIGPISQDGVAYPAADPNVFAVGAVDSSDAITTWTQRGDELDLLAPGVDIVMPQLGGGFTTEDGTSFASPYVAGTAALIKQMNSTAQAGDIGSILMASGVNNRDGDNEAGSTTGLLFSRLDIESALTLTQQRVGMYKTIDFGNTFDTAIDSQGVLHAVFYDAQNGDLLYTTRATGGMWSKLQVIDSSSDVGSQLSIAVDPTGKDGIAYYDATHANLKYASFTATTFATRIVESDRSVGTSPSLQFDTDGNAYLAYYKRSGGNLRLATLDRDADSWIRTTVDGTDGTDVGANLSLDVGEAALRTNGGFTVYDTTVAIAYADSTNGDLKYARLDVDDPAATWFINTVSDEQGVNHIDLNLHEGFLAAGLQAQIAYQDTYHADVKYAYRNTDWFVETVAASGKLGDTVQLSFDDQNNPDVIYYDRVRKALFRGQRNETNDWSTSQYATSAGPISVAINERTGEDMLVALNRPQTESRILSLI